MGRPSEWTSDGEQQRNGERGGDGGLYKYCIYYNWYKDRGGAPPSAAARLRCAVLLCGVWGAVLFPASGEIPN